MFACILQNSKINYPANLSLDGLFDKFSITSISLTCFSAKNLKCKFFILNWKKLCYNKIISYLSARFYKNLESGK